MIGQTLAIFLDAYRELNARWMFWITLIISAVFVGGFAFLGADGGGLLLFTHRIAMPDPLRWYHWAFDQIVIGMWLTWGAIVLALISTAGLFPDFISGGGIDLYLARPIGRARLFITKYLAGLLFVTLQVIVVAVGGFLVMGLRAHDWRPALFWSIPIVVCMFSYLFAMCVLFGVLTRSTIAALLITVLCWTLLAVLDRAEPSVLQFQKMYEWTADHAARRAVDARANQARAHADPKGGELASTFATQATEAQAEADNGARTARILHNVHAGIYAAKLITPKTTDTVNLLDRFIYSDAREDQLATTGMDPDRANAGDADNPAAGMMASAQATHAAIRARSPAWIIGTSLAFEAVLVLWAAWVFARRDY